MAKSQHSIAQSLYDQTLHQAGQLGGLATHCHEILAPSFDQQGYQRLYHEVWTPSMTAKIDLLYYEYQHQDKKSDFQIKIVDNCVKQLNATLRLIALQTALSARLNQAESKQVAAPLQEDIGAYHRMLGNAINHSYKSVSLFPSDEFKESKKFLTERLEEAAKHQTLHVPDGVNIYDTTSHLVRAIFEQRLAILKYSIQSVDVAASRIKTDIQELANLKMMAITEQPLSTDSKFDGFFVGKELMVAKGLEDTLMACDGNRDFAHTLYIAIRESMANRSKGQQYVAFSIAGIPQITP